MSLRRVGRRWRRLEEARPSRGKPAAIALAGLSGSAGLYGVLLANAAARHVGLDGWASRASRDVRRCVAYVCAVWQLFGP